MGGRGTPRYSISTSQDFTTALESPTSQPRINKGDLWQGRERKKRGKETSDPSPSPKVPRHTRKGRVVLRLRQRLNSDYFHSTGQRGQAGCCHLSRGRLCTRWIRISNLQSAVPHTSVRTGYLKNHSTRQQFLTLAINTSPGERALLRNRVQVLHLLSLRKVCAQKVHSPGLSFPFTFLSPLKMAFPVRWTSFPASPPFSASAARALSSAPGARTPSGRSTMRVPPKSPKLCSLPASLPPGPAVAGIRLSLPGGAARGRSTFSPRSRAPRPPSRLPAARRAPSRARPAAAPSPSRSHVLVPAARRAAPPRPAEDAPDRSPTPPEPRRASRGPRRSPASPASPTHPYRPAWGGGWRGPAPRVEDAPRGARDPGRPGRGTRAADGGGGGGENAGGDARGVAAERVPRSVHLRAPRLSGKYRGRLLRPRSRPAAYRPPAAAMTPKPRASATVSAARRRRGRRRLRLPSDVTAWAHSPFPARGCGGGCAHARSFRRRGSAGRGREGGAGRVNGRGREGGAGPGGGARPSGGGAAGGSGTHAALRGRAGLPEVGAPVSARLHWDGLPWLSAARAVRPGSGLSCCVTREAWEPSYWATLSPPAVLLARATCG